MYLDSYRNIVGTKYKDHVHRHKLRNNYAEHAHFRSTNPWQMYHVLTNFIDVIKTVLCKVGVTCLNFWNAIENGISWYSTTFYSIQIKGLWDVSFRSLEVFLFFVWQSQSGLEDISCPPTWLPPYKTEEILQSLSGHNSNILKCSNLEFWEHIWNGAHYLLTNIFEDNC